MNATKPSWKTYKDFVIKIESLGEERYRVEAQGPTGEAVSTFDLPFDPKDIEIFLLKVGRPRQSVSRGRIPEPVQQTVDFGTRLFNSVFTGQVRDIFVGARSESKHGKYGLRLRLRLIDVPELADLPWEFLYDGRDFIALSDLTPIVRYLDLPDAPRVMKVDLPLRILVTVSAPRDQARIDVDSEMDKIKTGLSELVARERVEVTFSKEATLRNLQHDLRHASSEMRPFHVWHYIGHGAFDPVRMESVLLFCDEDGMSSPVGGFQLGTLFQNYPETRLTLLNACEGARNDRDDPFSGIATALVERGIPAVIGMQFELSDDAAITFSEEFYQAIVDGLPIDTACTNARRAVFFLPNWIEWATPVLYMRSPDGRIFDIAPTSSEEEIIHTENLLQLAEIAIDAKEWETANNYLIMFRESDPDSKEADRLQDRLEAGIKKKVRSLPASPATPDPVSSTSPISETSSGMMADRPHPSVSQEIPQQSVSRRRSGLPSWIWIGLIAVALLGVGFLYQIFARGGGLQSGLPLLFAENQTEEIPTSPTMQPASSQLATGASPVLVPSRTLQPEPTTTHPPPTSIEGRVEIIAFDSDRDDNWEIYTIKTDGSGLTRLTNHPDIDWDPVWSPDGTRIAFESKRRDSSTWEIYSMIGDDRAISTPLARGYTPSWSPDGTMIVYSEYGTLAIINANGSGKQLLNLAIGDNPAWSPDGQNIAFSMGTTEEERELALITPDGINLTQLTQYSAYTGEPAWSPDSSRLAFVSNLDGNYEIYIYDLKNRTTKRLTNHNAEDREPSWSPDGTRIAFRSTRDGNWEIYLMNADGSEQTNITNHPADDDSPSWFTISENQ